MQAVVEIKTGPDRQGVAEWPGEFSIGSSKFVCLFVAELNHSSATYGLAEIVRAGGNPFNEILGNPTQAALIRSGKEGETHSTTDARGYTRIPTGNRRSRSMRYFPSVIE